MATRDRTLEFQKYRGSSSNSFSSILDNPYIKDISNEIQELSNDIQKFKQLSTRYCIPEIIDKYDIAPNIESRNSQINKKFKVIKNKIDKIHIEINCKADEIVLKNVKTKFTKQLSNLLLIFRKEQLNIFEYSNELNSSTDPIFDYVPHIKSQHSHEPQNLDLQEILLTNSESLDYVNCSKNIYQSMVELHDLFQDVSILVETQGEMLDRIDIQIEQSVNNVEHGKESLIKSHNSTKNENCGCKGILLLTLIIMICILSFSLFIKIL